MRIEPNEIYEPDSVQLSLIGKPQTLARYRHEGRGPNYIKLGKKILYLGQDVLTWLEEHQVNVNKRNFYDHL